MIFLKNITSFAVIEAELARIKVLYAKALEKKNEASVAMLRRSMKLLKAERALRNSSEVNGV